MENATVELGDKVAARPREPTRWRTRYARYLMTASMVGSDLVGLAIAGALAILARRVLLGPFTPDLLVWFGPTAVLMIILSGMRHLYPGIGLGAVEEFRSLTIAISLTFTMVSVISLVLQEGDKMSRFVYIVFWMVSMVSIPALRRVTRHVMTVSRLWGLPVVIIGPVEAALRMHKQFTMDPKTGLKPVAVAVLTGEIKEVSSEITVCTMDNIKEVCQRRDVRVAVALYNSMDEVEVIAAKFRESFEHLILFHTSGNNLYLNKVRVQNFGGLVSLSVHHPLLDRWAQALKRTLDIMLAGIATLFMLPFFFVLAGLIWLDSGGPIFYRQTRLGKRDKLFTMYKFRTMYTNSDGMLAHALAQDSAQQNEWDTYQKLRRDPRITRVGKVLRRLSLDELAQLWNVLKGEMSLVGPRPLMPNQREKYGENYQHYTQVTPGISGLWQINGRSEASFERRAELDMEYVVNWNVWLDIYILVRTVWVVLLHNGAY